VIGQSAHVRGPKHLKRSQLLISARLATARISKGENLHPASDECHWPQRPEMPRRLAIAKSRSPYLGVSCRCDPDLASLEKRLGGNARSLTRRSSTFSTCRAHDCMPAMEKTTAQYRLPTRGARNIARLPFVLPPAAGPGGTAEGGAWLGSRT
jgi:hypothetical protein